MSQISFKPLTDSDIHQLFIWMHQPEVARWYHETDNWQDFKYKFESKIANPEKNTFSFIVYVNKIAIGYIQYYIADKVGNGWWPHEKPGTVGIDQFIGNLEYINKGYGTRFISEFIQKIVLTNSKIKKIIVDVDPENKRAVRCYQKVGFEEQGIIDTPDGKALLMVYKKNERIS